jgi:hypothetical protein
MVDHNDVVRLVAGPFHDSIVGIWSGARIGDYLLASAARRHVWHAWLAARGDLARSSPDEVRRHLVSASARALLGEAHGDVPPGLIRAPGRLGPRAQPRRTYSELAAVLADGGPGAKLVRHAESLDARTLSVLAALPAALRLKTIAARCKIDEARYIAWLISRAPIGERELMSLMRKVSSPHRRMVNVIEEHLASGAIPEPPFATMAPLSPITSLTMLHATSRRFQNCLREYSDEVLGGSRCFYLWEGDEPAVLTITRIGSLGWRAGELAGLKNAPVSVGTRLAIAEAFGAAPSLFSEDLRAEDAA